MATYPTLIPEAPYCNIGNETARWDDGWFYDTVYARRFVAEVFAADVFTANTITVNDLEVTNNITTVNLTANGTIAGPNVTSGADPGHTHTIYLKADGTVNLTGNLTVDALVTIDGRDISVDGATLDTVNGWGDHASGGYLKADGTVNLTGNLTVDALVTIDGRDISVDGATLDTVNGWGDHASGGYLKADGTVPLTGDWTTGIFSIIGSDHWYLRADNTKMYFGAVDDASIYYDATHLIVNSQEVGAGSVWFPGTTGIGIGTEPGALHQFLNIIYHPVLTATTCMGIRLVMLYGDVGSGNTGVRHYAIYMDAGTAVSYNGNPTSLYGAWFTVTHRGSGVLAEACGFLADIIIAGSGNVTTARVIRVVAEDNGAGTFTNVYGLHIGNITVGSTLNYAIYTGLGDVYFGDDLILAEHLHLVDNKYIYLGTGNDATIYYDNANLIINPKVVGAGIVDILGVLQVDGYNAADGTAGATADVAVAKVGGGTRTLTFKDGLYISYADS